MFHRRRATTGRTGDAATHRDTSYKRAAAFRTAASAMSLPTIALLLAGCSAMPPVDTMATGSVPVRASAYAREPIPKGIAAEDWTAARGALTEALGTKVSAPSVPWENLASATRGTVTPLAERSADGGGKCREFLMSFVRDEREEWLQGEACKAAKGAWKVDQARMLERS